MAKTFIDTYLFSKYPEYEKKMLEFIITGDRVDKSNKSFDEIKSSIKRCRISNNFVKLLESKNIVLITTDRGLPKTLKTFTAKDVKDGSKLKTFIDCTGIITNTNGVYEMSQRSSEVLVSYLLDAMVSHIYFADSKILFMNSTVVNTATSCFSSLFTNIIDYIGKISIVQGNKDKCEYITALYFQSNILGRDADSESCRRLAMSLSGISEREQDIIDMQIIDGSYNDLKILVKSIAKILKIDKLTLEIVVEKWMFLYGPGTVFALEFFPNFSNMITDAYVGCFINNQKTIEKVVDKDLVEYTKKILLIGAENL